MQFGKVGGKLVVLPLYSYTRVYTSLRSCIHKVYFVESGSTTIDTVPAGGWTAYRLFSSKNTRYLDTYLFRLRAASRDKGLA